MVNASQKLPPHRNAILNIRKLAELLARCLHTSSASGTTLYFRRCGIDGRRPSTNDPGTFFVEGQTRLHNKHPPHSMPKDFHVRGQSLETNAQGSRKRPGHLFSHRQSSFANNRYPNMILRDSKGMFTKHLDLLLALNGPKASNSLLLIMTHASYE